MRQVLRTITARLYAWVAAHDGSSWVQHRMWWGREHATYSELVPCIQGGTDATSSQNSYISFGDSASPATYTEIAEVKNIGGPNEDSEELDATHLRSTGGYREYLQSFKDGGEVPLTMNFIPSNATQDSVTGIRSLYASGAVRQYKVNFPDGSYVTFDAYVKAIGTAAVVGQILELNVTLRITGATTWVEV